MVSCFRLPLMQGLYDSIKSNPFKIPDGDGSTSAFVNPERNGWLVKEGVFSEASIR